MKRLSLFFALILLGIAAALLWSQVPVLFAADSLLQNDLFLANSGPILAGTEQIPSIYTSKTSYRSPTSVFGSSLALPPGSVLLMHLDEPAGSTTFVDSSGNGNHASCSGNACPTAGASGMLGTAVTFDSSNDYVAITNPINLANSSFTVAFWANRDSTGTHHMAYSQGQIGVDQGLHIGFRGAGDLQGNNRFTCAFYDDDLNTLPYLDLGWHHWACTFDASTLQRRIYRDGELVAQDTALGPFQGTGTTYVGRSPWTDYFHGRIDELAVYDRMLSATELRALLADSSFTAVSKDPVDNGLGLAPGTAISATLSKAIDSSTASSGTFTVWGQLTGVYTGTYNLVGDESIQFDAHHSFKPGERVLVHLSQGLQAMDGMALIPYAWQFDTAVAAGTGLFTDSGQRLGNAPSRAVLGDVDGDGDLDAFVANHSFPNEVWLNDGTGTFLDSGQALGNTSSVAAALGDLDGDGDLDAFVAESDNNRANKVWLNDGSGTFTDSGQNLGSSDSQVVALGDVDGDGDLDAFVGNFWSQPNKVWLNDGNAMFTDSGQNLGSSRARTDETVHVFRPCRPLVGAKRR